MKIENIEGEKTKSVEKRELKLAAIKCVSIEGFLNRISFQNTNSSVFIFVFK